MDDQLQQLIQLQKEQNELFNRYLWRLRLSLLGLLLMTTATAIGLGVVAYQRSKPVIVQPLRPPTTTFPAPTRYYAPAPAGDIEIRPNIPGST
jgi:hypothetical protein